MALVERLMGLEEPKIPVHEFFAAASEVERGALTAVQVQTFLNMDAAAIAEWTALAALVAGPAASRLSVIQRFHAVFLLAENLYPQYSTPAEVRSKLGI